MVGTAARLNADQEMPDVKQLLIGIQASGGADHVRLNADQEMPDVKQLFRRLGPVE